MYPALFTTPGVRQFAEEIDAERQRQLAKFGEQHHPDGTGRAGYVEKADAARFACQMDADEPNGPRWSLILLEEVYEALAESDHARLRTELVQVAAVCAAWIADLDSRES
jgi:protein involved in temperature-dependent protein secretion